VVSILEMVGSRMESVVLIRVIVVSIREMAHKSAGFFKINTYV